MEQKIEPALFPVRELEEREFEPATRLIFTKGWGRFPRIRVQFYITKTLRRAMMISFSGLDPVWLPFKYERLFTSFPLFLRVTMKRILPYCFVRRKKGCKRSLSTVIGYGPVLIELERGFFLVEEWSPLLAYQQVLRRSCRLQRRRKEAKTRFRANSRLFTRGYSISGFDD